MTRGELQSAFKIVRNFLVAEMKYANINGRKCKNVFGAFGKRRVIQRPEIRRRAISYEFMAKRRVIITSFLLQKLSVYWIKLTLAIVFVRPNDEMRSNWGCPMECGSMDRLLVNMKCFLGCVFHKVGWWGSFGSVSLNRWEMERKDEDGQRKRKRQLR